MTLKLIRFGTYLESLVTLPELERSHELGNGASRLLLVDSPDGQFDLLGTERARRAPLNISYSCMLYSSTLSGLQTELDALRAMRGTRDKLWEETASGDVRWVTARLDSISGLSNSRNSHYIPLVINFAILEQHWNGAHHGDWTFDSGIYFDDGYYLDAGEEYALSTNPITLTITNGGNEDVENCILTITAQTSSITNLVIKRIVGGITQEHLVYAGTILATESLVIDCGAQSVKNDGVGDSANFSRGADHKYDGWLKLEPGDNPIQITRTGGGATSSAEFNFDDGWA